MVEVDLGFCPRCGGQLGPCEGQGSHRSCCTVCRFVVYHNPFPVVDATVVDGDRALFVRRVRAPERGCWSLPGGYLEVGERPEAGAARELREEIAANPPELRAGDVRPILWAIDTLGDAEGPDGEPLW